MYQKQRKQERQWSLENKGEIIRLKNTPIEKLESLQAQVGQAKTGAWKGTNRDKLNEELGWEPLHLRRWFRRLTVFYKIMHGLTPQYLVDPVPPLTLSGPGSF